MVTAGCAALATTNEVEVDLTRLSSEDSEAAQAMDRVRERFADPTAVVQVILDAGPTGDVLTVDGLEALTAAQGTAVDALGDGVRTDGTGDPQVRSLRTSLDPMLASQGLEPRAVGDAQVGALATRAVTASPQLAALVSDDLDVTEGTARGAAILLLLDPELAESGRTDAGERVRDAIERDRDGALTGLDVTGFSNGLFVAGMLDAIRAEVPLLFGLALLVVPVLLVGLGIDYSVHLAARYREERAAGQGPVEAAGRALHTVGAALFLATAATAIGFASIATAPVQMLADFGLFVAIGVVCAFLLLGLLVPAARVLHDRSRANAGSDIVRELALTRFMHLPVRLADAAPWAGMVVAAGLMVVSLAAAVGVETEFDRDDFVPEGSDVEAILAHQDELFGGGVTESTFVVVDGDLTDPAVANALWHAQERVAEVDGVRSVGSTSQVMSVVTLAASALDPGMPAAPGGGQPPAEGLAGTQLSAGDVWTGEGFADDADLEAVYAWLRATVGEPQVSQLLAPDASAAVVQLRTTVGDAQAQRLRSEVELAFAPVGGVGADVTVTSESIIIAEMSEELASFQVRAIALTLAVVLVLLTGFYAVTRRPLLGAIAMIPATVSASLVLGTMRALGISFNVLTATLTAIAVGIGVPYGIHIVNRLVEDLRELPPNEAVTRTLRSTGGALAGSALTTLGAFVVLALSGLPPIRSLGLLGGAGIIFALLAALLVEPGALMLWARHHDRAARAARRPEPA